MLWPAAPRASRATGAGLCAVHSHDHAPGELSLDTQKLF